MAPLSPRTALVRAGIGSSWSRGNSGGLVGMSLIVEHGEYRTTIGCGGGGMQYDHRVGCPPRYLLRVQGVQAVVGLEGFGPQTLPQLSGLAVETWEDDQGGVADYTIRLDRVVPSRADPPPLGRALRPFRRCLRGNGGDRVVLRGGTVALVPGSREAVLTLRSASRSGSAPWQAEAVLTALQHALALEGWATLHAAAFELDGRGVLAVGPTRAGKTTLALAALAGGGHVVSDDWLAVGRPGDGEAVSVLPLRRDLWLREGSLEILAGRTGDRPEAVGSRGEGRWRVGRVEHPELFLGRLEPRVVLHMVRDRRLRGFRIRRLTAAEGLARIMRATTPLFLSARYRAERSKLLPVLSALVNEALNYEVRLGTGLVERPAPMVRDLVYALE